MVAYHYQYNSLQYRKFEWSRYLRRLDSLTFSTIYDAYLIPTYPYSLRNVKKDVDG
ncbi:MAG: hypothetical protein F6K17_11290 [Okeania sp. SIO3C4]|nr:hypothetical protein [Okeania sp. SIO3B3]NER03164.1 hypothetical protein [Okeania sp. SIO3C4]